MKAMIMAGGEGSRLRPLTCDCPKPMVPLMNKPVMEYALRLLKRHGVHEAGVTLGYLPDRVMDYFGDGRAFGVNLRYYTEETPLGTAGGIRQAADFLNETCVILSGDGVTDCDLTAALAFHKERGAEATLVLKHVENPLEYGVVITDPDGRVRRFVEKPTWGEVFSDTVNTGIYILEPEVLSLIPTDRPFDFGRELFPGMVAAHRPVYAYVMDGYWCDIGDISAYLKAHIDAMDGRIRLDLPIRPGGVCRMPGAQVDQAAVLEGPCFIGEGARVMGGARVGAYSVLGQNSLVGRHASIKRSVLWPDAMLGERAQARGVVMQTGSSIGTDAAAFEESALGDGASLGARATLLPGVKVWPRKSIPDGARVDANVVWGGTERPSFRSGSLPLTSPAQAIATAQAYCAAIRPASVLIGRAASAVALANYLATEAGLMAQGVQVLEAGATTAPQLRHALKSARVDGALLIAETAMHPLDASGADLKTDLQRKIEGMLLRQDYARPFVGATPLPIKIGRTDLFYTGALAGLFDLRTSAPRVAVYAPDEQLLGLAERALERAGCVVRAEWETALMTLEAGEVGIFLSPGGESVELADASGRLSQGEMQLLLSWAALQGGAERLMLPTGDTRLAERLAEQCGAQVIRVQGERARLMRALIDEDPDQFALRYDGLYAALKVLSMLSKQNITLEAWRADMPPVNRQVRTVPLDWQDKGRVLRALAEAEPTADLSDGISVTSEHGWVWISPSNDEAHCYVVSEAADAETAAELCDFYTDRIQAAARNP